MINFIDISQTAIKEFAITVDNNDEGNQKEKTVLAHLKMHCAQCVRVTRKSVRIFFN